MIFLALMMGTLLAAWYFVLRPRGKNINRLQARIEEKQRLVKEMETSRPRAIGNLKQDIQKLEEIVGDQKVRLPRDEKVEKVFQDLSDIARANDLRIHHIRTSNTAAKSKSKEEQENSPIEEQGFILELEGSFQGVRGFLVSLEKQPRVLYVDDLRIQRVSKESGESTVLATLNLRVFNRKGPKAL
jgi:Tfp pilus assembly protein PilO